MMLVRVHHLVYYPHHYQLEQKDSEFFIMPPEYTGWIQFNSGSNNCIIEIPDNLVYSHKPELNNITIDFFKGWNIELIIIIQIHVKLTHRLS